MVCKYCDKIEPSNYRLQEQFYLHSYCAYSRVKAPSENNNVNQQTTLIRSSRFVFAQKDECMEKMRGTRHFLLFVQCRYCVVLVMRE